MNDDETMSPTERLYRSYLATYVADMVRLDRDGDDGLYDPEDGPASMQYQHEMLGDLIYNAQPCDMGTILLHSEALKQDAIDEEEWQELLAHFAEQHYDLDSLLLEIGYLLMQRDILTAYASAKAGRAKVTLVPSS